MKYLDILKKASIETLRNKISRKLLGFEFESDNYIKSKAVKYIVRKIPPSYK